MDLSSFIYDFNLVTTKTANNIYESCFVINNGRNKDINYENCISLYEIVKMFNDAYLEYKKDRDEFSKLLNQLGGKVIYGYHGVSDTYTSLSLEVIKPFSNIFDEDYAIVHFISNEGRNYVSANNGRKLFDKEFRNKVVDLDELCVSRVLEIVREHDVFLESYRDLLNKFVFGNGTTVVFTKVEGDLLGEVDTFTLTFGNSYFNTTDYIEVKFRLGEELEIIYDEAKVTIRDEEIIDIEEKKRIIQELISGIYIHSDNLSGLYKSSDKKKVFVKEDEK